MPGTVRAPALAATSASVPRARPPFPVTVSVVIDGLDPHQREAATCPLGPLAIVAGPGSGKTRTVVARIHHLVSTDQVSAPQVLALTHTTKAAGELRERLEHSGTGGATCATVHATAWRQVRALWQMAGVEREPQLIASSWSLVRDAIARTLGRAKAETSTVTDVAGEIEWARAWLLDPHGYAIEAADHGRSCALEPDEIALVWNHYTAAKAEQGVLDFADVLELAAQMMNNEAVAARVRAKWSAFFLDEYQDIDHQQQRLVDAWLGGRETVTVTGDPEQAIFGFKGGDPSLLTNFADRYPHAKVIHLTNNYRSTPSVVEWVNALTITKRPKLVGHQKAVVKPNVVMAADERSEEQQLVAQLREWRRSGVAWEEMAVLFRFNATAARIEGALSSAAIPYQTAGQVRFFERQEVRAVLVPFGQLARVHPTMNGLACLLQAAESTGWDEDQPPQGVGAACARWEAVQALVSLVREDHDALEAVALLGELQRRAKSSSDVALSGVTLATIHAAKGLEWDAVWIVGAVEGQVPSAYAITDKQLNEEQHLLYVAVSRARHCLVLSWSQRRQNNWRAERSRFIALLPGQTYTPTGRSGKYSGSKGGGRNAPSRGPALRSRPSQGAGASAKGASSPGLNTSHVSGRARNTDSVSEDTVRESAAAMAVEELFSCGRCGDRLIGRQARLVRRCSGRCLEGLERERYETLDAWRRERAEALGLVPQKVASDKTLFGAAVDGSTARMASNIDPAAGPAPF
jgi:DNA helicase-2/ATP-dependent DNA helicase PcrA